MRTRGRLSGVGEHPGAELEHVLVAEQPPLGPPPLKPLGELHEVQALLEAALHLLGGGPLEVFFGAAAEVIEVYQVVLRAGEEDERLVRGRGGVGEVEAL